MVGSLTELLKTYPENEVVIDNWVEGIFPLILDVEQKIAEKVQEVIWEDTLFVKYNMVNILKLNGIIKIVGIHFSIFHL